MIEDDDPIIYDVADETGQIVDNVKHMRWFIEFLAKRIKEEKNNG